MQLFSEANQYFSSPFRRSPDVGTGDAYPYCEGFTDPTATVRGGLNELAFRVGAKCAVEMLRHTTLKATLDPGVETMQRVVGFQSGTHSVYKTDFIYFICAALLEVVCITMILPLYWDFWRLGRPVSWSPLEIAKVRTTNSNQ